MHRPGIEPESQEWEARMIPLHQRCSPTKQQKLKYKKCYQRVFFWPPKLKMAHQG